MRKAIATIALTNLLTASMFLTVGYMDAHEANKETKSSMNMSGGMMNTSQCNKMMMSSLGKADKQYDLRFINEMIPHHEGAIMMAQDAKQHAQHPEIKEMAQNVIDGQQKEIDQMKAWRKAWYSK
jgi:uncharacterized protein (DUF305 family)